MTKALSFDEYVWHVRNKNTAWSVVMVADQFSDYPHGDIHEWEETYENNGLWYCTGDAAVFEDPEDAMVFKLKFGE